MPYDIYSQAGADAKFLTEVDGGDLDAAPLPITLRRGTTAERNASNPILAAGEPAVVLDSGQPAELVLGDGVTAMADLRAAVWDDDARLALAGTATQPGDLGTAAAADVADFATAAQGAKADTAVQPADLTAYATDAELTTGLATKAAALGADDNYVTDAEKVKLSNLSGTNTGDQTLPTWTTIAGKPAVVAEGATQAAARTAIGAGTSSLVIGTGAGDAKAGNYQPTASNISDSTTTGRALLTAADAAAARATLGVDYATTDAVVFVTASGNDTNSGLNVGAAKRTLQAAYAALPATGGHIQLGAGTFTLAATGATTGLTITPGKPAAIRGIDRTLSRIVYNGTGTALQIGDGVTQFLDWGSLEDVGIYCAAATGTTIGIKIADAHRGTLNRVAITAAGNPAGSVALRGDVAYGLYVRDSLLYGFGGAVLCSGGGGDFTFTDTDMDAGGAGAIVFRTIGCGAVRIMGGQISGTDAAVGIQIDTAASNLSGIEIHNVYFDTSPTGSATLAIALAPAATSSNNLIGPTVATQCKQGITVDRVVGGQIAVSDVGAAALLTANSSGVHIWSHLTGGTLTDNGSNNTLWRQGGNGALKTGSLTLLGACAAVNGYTTTGSALAFSSNPATAAGTLMRSLVGSEANERFAINYAGQAAWGAGGGAGTDLTISRKGAGALGIGGAIAPLVSRQTLAANGAVAFDLRYGQIYVETLQANATSSSVSGGTPADGQHLTICWKQDATGGRTYVWPTNARFAGGAAPTDTTASTKTQVSFYYDATDTKWVELSRAVAVPTA